MSIINDALKKTQAELLKKALQPSPQEITATASTQNNFPLKPPGPPLLKSESPKVKTKKPTDKTKIFLWILIVLCLGLLAGMVFVFSWISRHGLPSAVSFQKQKSPSGIVINGVIVRNNKNAALINNEIYEAGETVNGKRIVSITLEKVDILDGDQIKSFPVHKKR